ncbi:MAG TPA: sodium-independent anion transporter [Burkholderiales bacterium]|nr:sodium-independent anion transporter [Burkholderiales bacterium]
MLTVAWGLVDTWTRSLVRRIAAGERDRALLWSAAVVVLVAAITVFFGFVVAVVAGVFLSMALFIASMNRSLVRSVHSGAARPSRRIYGPEEARVLSDARRAITVVELEGALFFGSAERLGAEVEPLAATARFIVLDLQRVTTIDATGAIALEQLSKRLDAARASLLLAGITPQGRHGVELVAAGTFVSPASRRWFVDADRALEWAEDRLLGAERRALLGGFRSSGSTSSRGWTPTNSGLCGAWSCERSSTRTKCFSARASPAIGSTCSPAAPCRSWSAAAIGSAGS